MTQHYRHGDGDHEDRMYPHQTGLEVCEHGADANDCPECARLRREAEDAAREAENAEWDLETTKERRAEASEFCEDHRDDLLNVNNREQNALIEDALGYDLRMLNKHISRHGLDN